MIILMCDPSSKSRVGAGEVGTGGGDASPCVSPDPQGSCAVPFVSADRAAVATQSRCRDGQEPALVRRVSASGGQVPTHQMLLDRAMGCLTGYARSAQPCYSFR